MYNDNTIDIALNIWKSGDFRVPLDFVHNWKTEITRKDDKLRHLRRDVKLLRKQLADEKVKVEMYCNVISVLKKQKQELLATNEQLEMELEYLSRKYNELSVVTFHRKEN